MKRGNIKVGLSQAGVYAIAKRAGDQAMSRRGHFQETQKGRKSQVAFTGGGGVEENIQGGILDILEDWEGRGRC